MDAYREQEAAQQEEEVQKEQGVQKEQEFQQYEGEKETIQNLEEKESVKQTEPVKVVKQIEKEPVMKQIEKEPVEEEKVVDKLEKPNVITEKSTDVNDLKRIANQNLAGNVNVIGINLPYQNVALEAKPLEESIPKLMNLSGPDKVLNLSIFFFIGLFCYHIYTQVYTVQKEVISRRRAKKYNQESLENSKIGLYATSLVVLTAVGYQYRGCYVCAIKKWGGQALSLCEETGLMDYSFGVQMGFLFLATLAIGFLVKWLYTEESDENTDESDHNNKLFNKLEKEE